MPPSISPEEPHNPPTPRRDPSEAPSAVFLYHVRLPAPCRDLGGGLCRLLSAPPAPELTAEGSPPPPSPHGAGRPPPAAGPGPASSAPAAPGPAAATAAPGAPPGGRRSAPPGPGPEAKSGPGGSLTSRPSLFRLKIKN